MIVVLFFYLFISIVAVVGLVVVRVWLVLLWLFLCGRVGLCVRVGFVGVGVRVVGLWIISIVLLRLTADYLSSGCPTQPQDPPTSSSTCQHLPPSCPHYISISATTPPPT